MDFFNQTLEIKTLEDKFNYIKNIQTIKNLIKITEYYIDYNKNKKQNQKKYTKTTTERLCRQ